MEKFNDIAGWHIALVAFILVCVCLGYAWLASLIKGDAQEADEPTELDMNVTYDPRSRVTNLESVRAQRREMAFMRGGDPDQIDTVPPGGGHAA
jgi:hypothetical protein